MPLHLSAQKPPETVSEVAGLKNFLGEHAPRPPNVATILHYDNILYG